MAGNSGGFFRLHKAIRWIGIIYCIAVIARLTLFIISSATPFDTDEADHANLALELYRAFSRTNPQHIYQAIVRQSFYPPFHSLFVALSYAVFGIGLFSSRLPSVIMLTAILIILILATARSVNLFSEKKNESEISCISFGILAVSLFVVSSPILLDLSVLCMLEPLGCALTAVLLYFCAKRPEEIRQKQLIVISSVLAAIALTKYSFIITVFPAVCTAILIERFTLKIDMKRLKDFFKVMLATSIPIFIWIMIVDKQSLLFFFTGHRQYVPFWSVENWTFYPKAWLTSYSIHPIVGMCAVIFAIRGACKNWFNLAVRTASWIVIFSLLVFTISTTNEVRHIILIAPAIWFLAGIGVFSFLHNAFHGDVFYRGTIYLFLACFFALTIVNLVPQHKKLHGQLEKSQEGIPEYYEMQEFIVSNVDPRYPILVHGSFDQLGIETLRWAVARRGGLAYTEVKVDSFPFSYEFNLYRYRRRRNVDRAFLDRSLPKKNLREIIKRGYYRYFIAISRTGKKMPFYNDFGASLIKSSLIRHFDSWQVVLYELYYNNQHGK